MSVNPEEYRNWTPDAQAKALEIIRAGEAKPWRPFYCPKAECDGKPHDEWEWRHARADQRPPPWNERWLTWLLSGGRGAGKTRTGAELMHRAAEYTEHIIIVAPTGPDFRETVVEGESGVLATARPGRRPTWEPSRKRLVFPSGAVARGFSAEEPDRLRGPQSALIWMDEAAHYPDPDAVWNNALFGLRLGNPSHVLVTSTPKPTKWMKNLVKDKRTIVRRVGTYANLANLDPAYREFVIDKYEGTRLGRQELHGELLEDVEGALWGPDMFSYVDEVPESLVKVVVAVDPAGTANPKSDETGIIVVGHDGTDAYVLADYTGRYSPAGWGKRAYQAYNEWSADAIVPEKNYGGDMVQHVLDTESNREARVRPVNSRRGKALRAEPMVAKYEKGKVFHLRNRKVGGSDTGALDSLEDEQLTWVPGEGPSPNRVDAVVHGLTDVFQGLGVASGARPSDVLRRYSRSTTDIPRRRGA